MCGVEEFVGRQTKQFVRNKPSSKQGRKLGREGYGEGFLGCLEWVRPLGSYAAGQPMFSFKK